MQLIASTFQSISRGQFKLELVQLTIQTSVHEVGFPFTPPVYKKRQFFSTVEYKRKISVVRIPIVGPNMNSLLSFILAQDCKTMGNR